MRKKLQDKLEIMASGSETGLTESVGCADAEPGHDGLAVDGAVEVSTLPRLGAGLGGPARLLRGVLGLRIVRVVLAAALHDLKQPARPARELAAQRTPPAPSRGRGRRRGRRRRARLAARPPHRQDGQHPKGELRSELTLTASTDMHIFPSRSIRQLASLFRSAVPGLS